LDEDPSQIDRFSYILVMSTVQEIKAAIPKLPPKDLADLKAWLEDFCEDQLELNEDVKAALEQSHNEIATGQYRTRKP